MGHCLRCHTAAMTLRKKEINYVQRKWHKKCKEESKEENGHGLEEVLRS